MYKINSYLEAKGLLVLGTDSWSADPQDQQLYSLWFPSHKAIHTWGSFPFVQMPQISLKDKY